MLRRSNGKKINIEKNIVIMLGIEQQETKLKRHIKRGGSPC
jgi:hypothetical protein